MFWQSLQNHHKHDCFFFPLIHLVELETFGYDQWLGSKMSLQNIHNICASIWACSSYHITQQAIRFRSHHTQQHRHLFPRLNVHPSILSSPEGHNKLWCLCFSILMGATWKKCLIQWIFYYKNNRQYDKSYSVNKVKKAFSPLFKISQKRKIVFLFFLILIFICHPLLLISKSTVESRFFFHLWFVAGRSFLCLYF